MILFENVPAITSKRITKDSPKLVVDMIKEELAEAGYGNFLQTILDATDFGIPQRRKRFFILATRFPDWKLATPIPENIKKVTVGDALLDLPDVIPNSNVEGSEYTDADSDYSLLMKNDTFWHREGQGKKKITNHLPMKHRECTLKRFSLLKSGESLKHLFDRYRGVEREELQEQRILPKKMFIKRNYRLPLDETAPTLTSHCLDEFVHPAANRALTVRECARLQSFPDSYEFVGDRTLYPT